VKNEKQSALRVNLKHKLAEVGISVHALEKQAGLKRSAVQNIIHGKSKKPSADILFAITKVLGCQIQELVGQTPTVRLFTPSRPAAVSMQTTGTTFNADLYVKASKAAAIVFTQRQYEPNSAAAIDYIQEIYQYSVNSQKEEIDSFFAEWLFEKIFVSKI
jgi:transcriptional regulator with XRE-family HTH domain